MGMLQEVQAEISEEDYKRAEYVIEEIQRVLDVCDALEKDDYETVGQKMYETHYGMSKLYEVSCEELDFLNDLAFDCGVTGSRVMGGGFGSSKRPRKNSRRNSTEAPKSTMWLSAMVPAGWNKQTF